MDFSKPTSFFHDAVHSLPKKLQQVIESDGDYFDEYKIANLVCSCWEFKNTWYKNFKNIWTYQKHKDFPCVNMAISPTHKSSN